MLSQLSGLFAYVKFDTLKVLKWPRMKIIQPFSYEKSLHLSDGFVLKCQLHLGFYDFLL